MHCDELMFEAAAWFVFIISDYEHEPCYFLISK